jgi:threonine dehydrogenase-like Zn-dependent dehydrogenase
MGQGVSGLVITQVMKLYSPKALVVTDLKAKNLELAKKYGATHTYQLDSEDASTMDVVGKDFPSGFGTCIHMAKPHGTLLPRLRLPAC